MSHLDNALARIEQMLARRLRDRDPFRAIVTGTSGGMVRIRRLEAETGETELRARIPGWKLTANDEVLCLPVNGKPVILGPVQRSTTVTQGPEIGPIVSASSVGTVVGKVQVFNEDGTSAGWLPIYSSIT
jgi:hypothetical protein